MRSLYSEQYEVIIDKLIAARKRAKLTQEDLAALLGKPQSFVSKYERKERRLDIVEFTVICQHLKADAAAFINHIKSMGKSKR